MTDKVPMSDERLAELKRRNGLYSGLTHSNVCELLAEVERLLCACRTEGGKRERT